MQRAITCSNELTGGLDCGISVVDVAGRGIDHASYRASRNGSHMLQAESADLQEGVQPPLFLQLKRLDDRQQPVHHESIPLGDPARRHGPF